MNPRISAIASLLAISLAASQGAAGTAKDPKPVNGRRFAALANAAIATMKKRAAELNESGVAVVSYAPEDAPQRWTSKMAVVGRMENPPTATASDNNPQGISCAKSAEMADTLKESGVVVGPPMTGALCWQHGVIARSSTGYVFVAFSGGKSENDEEVSRSGLAVLKDGL